MNRKRLGSTALLATPLAIGLCFAGWVVHGSAVFWPRHQFTPEAWNASPSPERFKYYKDLTPRLTGKTRQEITDLLGRPDSQAEDWVVYVLKESGANEYGFDSVYFMRLTLDATGRVVSCDVDAD